MKPSKLDVCRATLLKGSTFVHLDPSTLGTLVPYRLKFQSQVVLQFGYDMPVPIPDMKLDQAGISGTLSFKGIPFSCFVPWTAVFAVVGEDGRGLTWDISQTLLDEMAATKAGKVVSLASHKRETIGYEKRSIPQKTHTEKREIPSYLRLVK